jgi:squalene cyclase
MLTDISPPLVNPSNCNKSDRTFGKPEQLTVTVEVVSLDIPSAETLNQAFEKIRTLPTYLKPIVLEGLAKKLKVSKKAVDKAFEFWMMERITQTVSAGQNNQNGEEV